MASSTKLGVDVSEEDSWSRVTQEYIQVATKQAPYKEWHFNYIEYSTNYVTDGITECAREAGFNFTIFPNFQYFFIFSLAFCFSIFQYFFTFSPVFSFFQQLSALMRI